MASGSDWVLGQKLVAQGVCSLDQVREALAEVDRSKRGLAVVLVERGVDPAKLRAAGLEVPERKPMPSPAVLAEFRPSRAPWVVAVLLLLAAGAWMFLRRDPAPTPMVEVDPDRQPREELEKLTSAEAPGFANAAEVVKGYEDYGRRWAGLKWELEAHRRLEGYRAKLEVPARAALEALAPREVELVAAGRLADALRLYLAYPASFLAAPSGATVKAKIVELGQKARAAYAKGRAEAEALLKDGKFKAAEERAKALVDTAPAEAAGEIEDLKSRIEHEARGARGKARQEVADKYLEADGRIKACYLRRPANPRAAAKEILAFVLAPWDEARRPFVRVEGADYEGLKKAVEDWDPDVLRRLTEAALPEATSPDRLSTGESAILDLRAAALVELFYRDVQAAVKKAVEAGSVLELPQLGKGRFEKQGESTVFVKDGAGIVEANAAPLSDEDLEALARGEREAGPERDLRAGFFYYLCSPNREGPAYERLERARKAGARGVDVFVGGLYLAKQVDLAKSLRVKFESARESFEKRQWVSTRKLLGELLVEAGHPYVKEQRPAIEKMLFEISEGSEAERRMSAATKGAAKVLPDGRVRVSYDFETLEQADGFEPPGEDEGRAFPGRWRIAEGGLASSREASLLRWKTPLKGDVEIDYDLTPLEEPQNVAVALYVKPGGHYAAVLGFDWVGRGEGDRDNSAEDRHGMPRACVIKYPVKADKLRWREADEWERWKERLVGQRTSRDALKPALGKTLRMSLLRKGASIRLLADGEEIWKGEDAEYGEGALAIFSDSSCRIEALTITGAFQPE